MPSRVLMALAVVLALVASVGLSPAEASSHGGDAPTVRRGATFHVGDGASGGAADAVFTYGRSSDTPLMCDWDGDGVASPAVVRGSVWHVRDGRVGGTADVTFHYGQASDSAICGDWNGDGVETPGVVRESGANLVFLLRDAVAGGPADRVVVYGRAGDVPLTGDWNGDGVHTPGVVRDGRWLLIDNHDGGVAQRSFYFGRSDDAPVVGDWNGDGTMTPGVVRGASWLLRNRHAGGAADLAFTYGRSSDQALVRYPIAAPTAAPEPTPDPDPEPEQTEVEGTVNAGITGRTGPIADVAVEAVDAGDPGTTLAQSTATDDGSWQLTVPDDADPRFDASATGWDLPGAPQADTDLLLETTVAASVDVSIDLDGDPALLTTGVYDAVFTLTRTDGGPDLDLALTVDDEGLFTGEDWDAFEGDIGPTGTTWTVGGDETVPLFEGELTVAADEDGVRELSVAVLDARSSDPGSPAAHAVDVSGHEVIVPDWTATGRDLAQQINAASFVSDSLGWVVSNGGTILHTADGGATWTDQSPATGSSFLWDVHFVDANTGWVVESGGDAEILVTTDGGATWEVQDHPSAADRLRSVHFVDANTGWVVGWSEEWDTDSTTPASILYTDDGGDTWSEQTSDTSRGLDSVHFVDTDNGWSVGWEGSGGGSALQRTTNGGDDWTAVDVPDVGTIRDVYFVDSDQGWAVGSSGTVLHSTDGGETWDPQDSGTDEHLYAVRFLDADTGWASGAAGTVQYTQDGGTTWSSQLTASGLTLSDLVAFGSEDALVVGGGDVLTYDPQ